MTAAYLTRAALSGHLFDVWAGPALATVQAGYLREFLPQVAVAPACGRASVLRVDADERVFADLTARLGGLPYRTVMPFRDEPYRRFRRGGSVWWAPEPGGRVPADHLYGRDAAGRLHVLLRPGARRGERYALRVVRDVVLRCSEARGWCSFHASAAAVNGAGVLVAGPSGHGKTTVVAALARHLRADLIASDRALVPADASAVTGFPLAFRVGGGTLAALGGVAARTGAKPSRTYGSHEKAAFTPRRFARSLGVRVRETAPLRLAVMPRLTDDAREVTVRRLGGHAAMAALARSCCTPDDEDRLQVWFADRTRAPLALRRTASALIERLTGSLPVVQVEAGVRLPGVLPRLAEAVAAAGRL